MLWKLMTAIAVVASLNVPALAQQVKCGVGQIERHVFDLEPQPCAKPICVSLECPEESTGGACRHVAKPCPDCLAVPTKKTICLSAEENAKAKSGR